ncbi:GNAT family N-acetyltransferase [Leptospirillum sp. Group II 'CF-1']|uniref:GCN5-related N-acetyltransferase n=1 Tax=Leptospirillum ferriphilum (strain ML-04) TaxID=1048260 RepID=J9ZBY7_LEPFM|nr:GNAT family N-acetyltransferase [Leptospirillum sp. Group II 'CF-1']AFS53378.1 GCN5-related N-acetyltransferase [Leptospirillum ferriphilum ML-04]
MDQAIDLSIRSTPGLRRPVGRLKSLRESLKIARPVITSCDREALVGIARTLTDFTDVASLAGLAVDLVYQKKGIGRELLRRTRLCLESSCTLVLIAALAADSCYAVSGSRRIRGGRVLKGE